MEGGVEGTMRTIKGPGIFLAQFAGDAAPFNSLKSIAAWAARLGYKGVQIPTWDARLFDLKRAAESKTYADGIRGIVEKHGLAITELSTHLQGQLVAVHPAYDIAFDGFAPPDLRGNPKARQVVYGAYNPWINRAGRFRSTGDGQVDYKAISSKLTQYDYPGWAVLEGECCIKSAEQGAAEGAPFIARHIIQAATTTFDDFASSGADQAANRRMLGLT